MELGTRRVMEAAEAALSNARRRVLELMASGEASRRLSRGFFGDVSLAVDVEAERAIISTLSDRLGSVAFVTEEGGILGNEDNHDYLVIIDPVDGSNNAMVGIPFFAGALAIAKGSTYHDIIAAVVVNYSSGEIYKAAEDDALKNGKPIRVCEDVSLNESFIAFDPRILKKQPDKGLELVNSVKNVRFFGSAILESLLVAEGKLHAFVAYPRIMRPLDFVPSAYILQKAHGVADCVDIRLDDLNLLSTERYAILAASGSRLLEELARLLTSTA
ncbi:MAG: hypothetical protein NXY59_03400 [Aigarchaeota archaeon]|nr:hypothetical protein [Candidatus Pelearchaeum maunauluense]